MWSKCESKQQIRCVKQQNWEPTSKYQGWSTKSLGCDMMWIFATKMTMISSANMEMFIRLLQVFVSTEKWGGKTLVSFCSPQNGCLSGWWFGTWILFSLYWEFDHPNWLTHIFQRGRAQAPTSCTNQLRMFIPQEVWMHPQISILGCPDAMFFPDARV